MQGVGPVQFSVLMMTFERADEMNKTLILMRTGKAVMLMAMLATG